MVWRIAVGCVLGPAASSPPALPLHNSSPPAAHRHTSAAKVPTLLGIGCRAVGGGARLWGPARTGRRAHTLGGREGGSPRAGQCSGPLAVEPRAGRVVRHASAARGDVFWAASWPGARWRSLAPLLPWGGCGVSFFQVRLGSWHHWQAAWRVWRRGRTVCSRVAAGCTENVLRHAVGLCGKWISVQASGFQRISFGRSIEFQRGYRVRVCILSLSGGNPDISPISAGR